ncbi:MAG: Unknown protein, partial [uncultured Sulfurovum sp.]
MKLTGLLRSKVASVIFPLFLLTACNDNGVTDSSAAASGDTRLVAGLVGPIQTLTLSLSSGNDDAEERSDGSMYLNSS